MAKQHDDYELMAWVLAYLVEQKEVNDEFIELSAYLQAKFDITFVLDRSLTANQKHRLAEQLRQGQVFHDDLVTKYYRGLKNRLKAELLPNERSASENTEPNKATGNENLHDIYADVVEVLFYYLEHDDKSGKYQEFRDYLSSNYRVNIVRGQFLTSEYERQLAEKLRTGRVLDNEKMKQSFVDLYNAMENERYLVLELAVNQIEPVDFEIIQQNSGKLNAFQRLGEFD